MLETGASVVNRSYLEPQNRELTALYKRQAS